MKKVYLSFLLIFLFLISYAQEQRIKQVQKDLQEHTQADTLRVNRLDELLGLIVLPLSKADSMANNALAISRKLHYSGGEVESLIAVSKVAYGKMSVARHVRFWNRPLCWHSNWTTKHTYQTSTPHSLRWKILPEKVYKRVNML